MDGGRLVKNISRVLSDILSDKHECEIVINFDYNCEFSKNLQIGTISKNGNSQTCEFSIINEREI